MIFLYFCLEQGRKFITICPNQFQRLKGSVGRFHAFANIRDYLHEKMTTADCYNGHPDKTESSYIPGKNKLEVFD